MTPLEHYREAERLLQHVDPEGRAYDQAIVIAQVHATLANAHMTAGVWSDKEAGR